MTRIPIIDLEPSFAAARASRERVAREIDAACRETGFFYVANHRIPQSVVDDLFAGQRAFFALPIAEKLALRMAPPGNRGYEPMSGQRLQADAPPDLKESFLAGWVQTPLDPYAVAGVQNYGVNRWPARLPEFAASTEAFRAEGLRLGRHLLRLFALALELPEHFFDASMEAPIATLRLLHYPPLPREAAAGTLGAGAHTDWGALTVLAQDDIGGLEVLGLDGAWIAARPEPGTFVINIGDMMQRWTNDLYRSTPHRVRNNTSGLDRYSTAMFIDLNYFARVECLPSCVSAERPARYAPCTAGEHIAAMYRRTYGGLAA